MSDSTIVAVEKSARTKFISVEHGTVAIYLTSFAFDGTTIRHELMPTVARALARDLLRRANLLDKERRTR